MTSRPSCLLAATMIAAVVLSLACGTKTPSRDHIPVLRQRVFELQEAIKAKNSTAIDSLLSVQILSIHENSDSLLSFVYGPDGDFDFQRLGNYDIFYTDDRARIDCFLMDTTDRTNRPVTLTYVYEHDLWLLKRFEPGVDKAVPVNEQ